LEESIVSFISDTEHAIWDYKIRFPIFGHKVYSNDLHFGNGKEYKPYARKAVAVYQVPIRCSSDDFEWADWEVFSVSKSLIGL